MENIVTETAMVKPTNKIVWDSINLHMQTKKIETVANVYPGRLLNKGTNDDDVITGAAYSSNVGPVGWAGYEQTAKKYRPATVDTIYVVNDQIAVLTGPGMGIVGCLAGGATIVKGQLLKAVASGMLSGATMGTDHVVAIAEESVTATLTAGTDCMVRSML